MKGLTYFVTGATGFLGGRLVEMLREKNATVVGYGRNAKAGARLEALGAKFVQGDLSNGELLKQSIPEGADVIHCGALSSPWGSREAFYDTNVYGTEHMANAALEKNCRRFVHISSPSIYIEKRSKLNIPEDSTIPASMINLYAETKWQAEQVIDRYTDIGLPAITLRPQGLFGPNDHTIMPRLIRVAKKGFLPVIGDEEVIMDLTFVDNVVQAIFCALEASDEFIGEKYNISNGAPVNQFDTMRDILGKIGFPVKAKHIPLPIAWNIAKAMEITHRTLHLNQEPLLTRYTVCALAFSRTLDISKARRELGYQPKIGMDEGIRRYVEWYRHE